MICIRATSKLPCWIRGPVERFSRSRQVVSYLGLNPSEHSSGGHQRLGHISKQGNAMLRWLLV
ncbi:MAG TPA: IS110 family transposase, partial [Terriglobia bacterium]|nr:IS110 family transposase [Terriglobia bacterium]